MSAIKPLGLAALGGFVAVILVSLFHPANSALAQEARRWKYQHELVTEQSLQNPQQFNDSLNRHGADGWEVVNIVVLRDRTVILYKKPM